MEKQKTLEDIEQMAADVSCLINVVKDSCEKNDYLHEQTVLEYAVNLQNEIISELFTIR